MSEEQINALQKKIATEILASFEKETGEKLSAVGREFFMLGHEVGFRDALQFVKDNLSDFMYG